MDKTLSSTEEVILHNLIVKLFNENGGPSNVDYAGTTKSWSENLIHEPCLRTYFLYYNNNQKTTKALTYEY